MINYVYAEGTSVRVISSNSTEMTPDSFPLYAYYADDEKPRKQKPNKSAISYGPPKKGRGGKEKRWN
jgi:hypothetical protein